METRCCLGCAKSFHPRAQCPNQKYCSKLACQQTRKRRWHRNKMDTDPSYRANQKDAQSKWLSSHTGYWRGYRAEHPDYVDRNRAQQRKRDQASRLAKMDVSIGESSIPSGRYRLTPVHTSDLAKTDAWMVNISVISTASICAP